MNTNPSRRAALWKDASSPASLHNRTCSEGCFVRRCQHGDAVTPCGVKRLQAEWPVDCQELPYGCAFNRESEQWLRRSVIVDQHALPQFEPSESCPSIRDVLNTASVDRWHAWQDCTEGCWDERQDESGKDEEHGMACGAGCILIGCQLRSGSPCCLKRAAAIWDVPCELLPFGCATGSGQWSVELAEHAILGNEHASFLDTPFLDANGASVGASITSDASVVDLEAVPRLEPSDQCPSFEDVLNTGRKKRWELWDDVRSDGLDRCADRCYQPHGCASGAHAPCCVVRRRAVWPEPLAHEMHKCSGLPYGCSGRLARHGLFYVDWNSFAHAVFVSGWAACIARWICAAAAFVAGLLLLTTMWLASRRRLRRRLPVATLASLIVCVATLAVERAAASVSAITDRSVERVLAELGEPPYLLDSL